MQALVDLQLSIVIASHREGFIAQCVTGIIQTAHPGDLFEIIVVADYPVAKLAKKFTNVQWEFCNDKSISAKRNVGISSATGEIVGFIDDDCIAQPGWAHAALSYLTQNPLSAGVAGKTSVERAAGVSYPVNEYKRLELPGYRTNNIFYRRSVLSEIHGFDERFSVQREDVDIAFTILETGKTIGSDPQCNVLHLHRSSEPWDLLKNCINRRFDPLLYKKHGNLYRHYIKTPFTPSIAVMLIVHGLSSTAVFALSSGLGNVVMIFSSMALALVLSIRRNIHCGFHGRQMICDMLSYWVSPFVLLGALVYGSVKFKKVFLL